MFYEKGNKAKAVFGKESWFYFSRAVEVLGKKPKSKNNRYYGSGLIRNYQRQTCRWQWIIPQRDVMSQVGEGLFSFDEKGEAKPALATEKYSLQ